MQANPISEKEKHVINNNEKSQEKSRVKFKPNNKYSIRITDASKFGDYFQGKWIKSDVELHTEKLEGN